MTWLFKMTPLEGSTRGNAPSSLKSAVRRPRTHDFVPSRCSERCNTPKSRTFTQLMTLRATCVAVYCNRSCLWVCLFVCVWVCYHDKSKFRAAILTKLGL